MGRGGGEERAEDRGGGACCARGTGNKDRVVLMWRFLSDVSSHRSPLLEPVPVRPPAAAAGDDGWIEVGGEEHHHRMSEALLYMPAVPGARRSRAAAARRLRSLHGRRLLLPDPNLSSLLGAPSVWLSYMSPGTLSSGSSTTRSSSTAGFQSVRVASGRVGFRDATAGSCDTSAGLASTPLRSNPTRAQSNCRSQKFLPVIQ